MNLNNSLKHIVLIPDGNRRWARKRGLPSYLGHRKGAEITEKILKASFEMKIPCFTFWGSSLDNIFKRSKKEVNFLFRIFEQMFKKVLKSKEIDKNSVKINVFGRWNKLFPEKLKKIINLAIKKTRKNKKYQLTFLMAYSGIDEMKEAIKKITKLKFKNPKLKINENLIKNNLWTKNLPAVDLVIRTGGEPHWSSGLMMWDVANSQFYFTDTLYPDFTIREFRKAVELYKKTERRMGG